MITITIPQKGIKVEISLLTLQNFPSTIDAVFQFMGANINGVTADVDTLSAVQATQMPAQSLHAQAEGFKSVSEAMENARELGLIERNGRIMVSSRDIAKTFEKKHKNILALIKELNCSEEFNRLNFVPITYRDRRGRLQPEYLMTRDGFTFLVMGFTGSLSAKFREAYIKAFNAMEAALNFKSGV